jgi:hypothetical protein
MVATKVDGKELSFGWTNGNGQRRIIVAKQGSAVTGLPVNGTDYAANGVFGSGLLLPLVNLLYTMIISMRLLSVGSIPRPTISLKFLSMMAPALIPYT